MNVIAKKVNIFYFSVVPKNLRQMLLIYVSCKMTDLDFSWWGSFRTRLSDLSAGCRRSSTFSAAFASWRRTAFTGSSTFRTSSTRRSFTRATIRACLKEHRTLKIELITYNSVSTTSNWRSSTFGTSSTRRTFGRAIRRANLKVEKYRFLY